jgi:beta-N-acetylhexosaminidase
VTELDRAVHTLLVPGFVGTAAPDWVRRRIDHGLGGVALFARNIHSVEQARTLTNALHATRTDVLVAVDEEGGDVTRLEAGRGSRHPGALALGAVDDLALTRQVAASIGALLRRAGVDWTWSPVADVSSNPDNPVIGVRSYGTDAGLVARHAAATVAGLQDDAGILA